MHFITLESTMVQVGSVTLYMNIFFSPNFLSPKDRLVDFLLQL